MSLSPVFPMKECDRMEGYKTILFEEHAGVARLTLNNPDNRNPLTEETKREMISGLDRVAASDTIRALLITGKGVAFCAGGDVKNIGRKLTDEEIGEVMGKSQELLFKLIQLEKPVISAVNGDAFGMGCNLALTADFVFASHKARFSQVFVKLGLTPDFGALYFLPRLIGPWKAKEMAYTGRVVDAAEAVKIGLIYKTVPHEELEKESMHMAERLARLPTRAIARAKAVLNKTYEMTLKDVLAEEIAAQIDLTKTKDHREGIRALLEKRKPIFQGK